MWLLIANPTSRSGLNAGRIERVRLLLDQVGIVHRMVATVPGRRNQAELVAELRSGAYRGVIAMGGDGTFGEVAEVVVRSGTGLPMGLIATGTGNNQARSFGIPPDDLERHVEIIALGHTAPVDGVWVEATNEEGQACGEGWFFDSMGFGFSAEVLQLRNEDREWAERIPLLRDLYRDQWVYAGATLRALLGSWVEEGRFDLTVRCSQGTYVLSGLHDLVLKNTRYYASVWVFDRTASPEDGEIELIPIYGQDEWAAAAVVNLDGLPMPEEIYPITEVIRASSFHLSFVPRGVRVPSQLDGDTWLSAGVPGLAELTVRVHKHALRLLVPAPVLS
jgi:diacylglycerol kinase family enzyme